MKISQPQNQGKAHTEGRGGGKTRGRVPQMLCLIGISWVLSCCFSSFFFGIAIAVFDSRLGSMTTFFFLPPSFRPFSGQMGASLDPAKSKSSILTSILRNSRPPFTWLSCLTFIQQTICGMPLGDAYCSNYLCHHLFLSSFIFLLLLLLYLAVAFYIELWVK